MFSFSLRILIQWLKYLYTGAHVHFEWLYMLQSALMHQVEQDLTGCFCICALRGFARTMATISVLSILTSYREQYYEAWVLPSASWFCSHILESSSVHNRKDRPKTGSSTCSLKYQLLTASIERWSKKLVSTRCYSLKGVALDSMLTMQSLGNDKRERARMWNTSTEAHRPPRLCSSLFRVRWLSHCRRLESPPFKLEGLQATLIRYPILDKQQWYPWGLYIGQFRLLICAWDICW